MKFSLNIFFILIFHIISTHLFPQDWNQNLKITATERASDVYFGASAAIYGDFAIIGANQENKDANEENTLSKAGAAYIYKNNEGNWEFYQKIVSNDRNVGDFFGYSVAIDGDYIVVGAPQEDEDENGINTKPNTGSVYIFKNIEGEWTQIQKICASDRNSDDLFGWSVSISGNNIVVGAFQQGKDEQGLNQKDKAGAAYVFEKQVDNWTQTKKLVANDRSAADYFGATVSIYENSIAIGAYLQDQNATNNNYIMDAGAVYVFFQQGGNWVQTQKLVANDRRTESYFGNSVSINNNYIIVGAFSDSENSNLQTAGAAYVFKYNAGTWQQQAKLKSNDLEKGDNFGKSVAINNEYALIGAINEDHDLNGGNMLFNAGAAYLFKLTNNSWAQIQKICPNDRGSTDAFGYAVAIGNYNFIVTANQEDHDINGENPLMNPGSAYIFRKKAKLLIKNNSQLYNHQEELNFGNIVISEIPETKQLSLFNDGGDIINLLDENIFRLQNDQDMNFNLTYDEEIEHSILPGQNIPFSLSLSPTSIGTKTAELIIYNDSEISNFRINLKTYAITSSISSIENQAISIYPNPANTNIYIKLGELDVEQFSISDISGRILFSQSQAKGLIDIDISNFPTGMYIINITSKDKTISSKFLVN